MATKYKTETEVKTALASIAKNLRLTGAKGAAATDPQEKEALRIKYAELKAKRSALRWVLNWA